MVFIALLYLQAILTSCKSQRPNLRRFQILNWLLKC